MDISKLIFCLIERESGAFFLLKLNVIIDLILQIIQEYVELSSIY